MFLVEFVLYSFVFAVYFICFFLSARRGYPPTFKKENYGVPLGHNGTKYKAKGSQLGKTQPAVLNIRVCVKLSRDAHATLK